MLSRNKFWLTVGASVLFLLIVMAWMPLVGSSQATLARALAGISPDREILLYARVPRVILAALAGGALALAGVVFQALLRDALAEPYTLGVSSGAALGAVISICLGWRSVGSFPAVWLAAFAGAALTIGLVVSMASEGRRMSSFTLLLTGVTINAMCMAAILFLHYSAGFTQSFAIVRWLMGGIDSVEYRTLGMLAAGILTAFALAVRKSPELNLLAVGEEWAATRGVNLPRLMFTSFLLGSFLTASVTALVGPIGFLGLIVPHALRLALGADHRLLVPASFCVGGGFLVLCDTLARTAMAPEEIPIGVITAMLGGPFFIWLLRSRRSSLWV
jgi:ABC-type Fe3+-siderophore transport system permease subunit